MFFNKLRGTTACLVASFFNRSVPSIGFGPSSGTYHGENNDSVSSIWRSKPGPCTGKKQDSSALLTPSSTAVEGVVVSRLYTTVVFAVPKSRPIQPVRDPPTAEATLG